MTLGADRRVVTRGVGGAEGGEGRGGWFCVEKHLGEVVEGKFLFVVMVTGSVVCSKSVSPAWWGYSSSLQHSPPPPPFVQHPPPTLHMFNEAWSIESYGSYRWASPRWRRQTFVYMWISREMRYKREGSCCWGGVFSFPLKKGER